MMLTYLLTVIITGSWLLKTLAEKKFEFQRTPLDIPIILFLAANVLSTIFSLDPHTSIFGYYGRWHGGLLSTFAYILLYYALVTHSDRKQIYYYLTTLLTSGLVVSIYGVLQHPNPLFRESVDGKTVLHGIDYDYWAVDAEDRVFSTLGQPNWLAAYLAMLIPLLISLLFIFGQSAEKDRRSIFKKIWQQSLVLIAVVVYFLAFTFTYSRGGTIGLLFGVLTFVVLFPIYKPGFWEKIGSKIPLFNISQIAEKLRRFLLPYLALVIAVVIVNYFWGNAIARRGVNVTSLPTISEQEKQEAAPPSVQQTQLEADGQETAKIRTIVWTGAVNIFRSFPIFGSGVETFGYSYYLFRPQEHNHTGEWDFLYNKAHNEYLNYLATTGIVGSLTYIILIATFEVVAIKTLFRSPFNNGRLLGLGLLSGFNANLAQNFFGFSVVPTALLFFTFPTIFFVVTESLDKSLVYDLKKRFSFLGNKTYNNLSLAAAGVLIFLGLLAVAGMWGADYFYNRSIGADTYQQAIRDLRLSRKLFPLEPKYTAELATNLSGLASSVETENERTKVYSREARELINQVVASHPNNTSVWIEKRSIDFNLSKVDEAAKLELLRTAERLKELAPTEASIQYDVALVYLYLEKNTDAITQLEKIMQLKIDYRDATLMLARTYIKAGETTKTIDLLQKWLSKNPTDNEASDLLKSLTNV